MTNNNIKCACLDHVDVKECRHCGMCLEYGGEFCPLEDERLNTILPLFPYFF